MKRLGLISAIICLTGFSQIVNTKEIVPDILQGLDYKMGSQPREPIWHPLLRDDAECGQTVCHPPFSICNDAILEKDRECNHKSLFPMYPMEIVGIVVLAILMTLCTVAGIGGGGITVPLLSVFFTFEFKEATAISGFSILICSITRYFYNFKQMHPEKKAVVIDYGLAIVMLPTVMMGSFVGVIMNAMLPDLILQILLTILLGFLTVQSSLKAREIFNKENIKIKAKKKALKAARESGRLLGGAPAIMNVNEGEIQVERRSIHVLREEESDAPDTMRATFEPENNMRVQNNTTMQTMNLSATKISNGKVDGENSNPHATDDDIKERNPYAIATISEIKRLDNLLDKEATHYQWDKHLICVILLFSNVLVSLFRGSKKSPSIIGIGTCSAPSWSFVALFVLICSICTFLGIRKVNSEQTLKQKVGRGMVSTDVKFERKVVMKLVVFALLGGWVSGALGLGGGAIFNPLLLSMGVPPSVASSTGMYMILFSTAGSSITYLVFGTLNLPFGLWIGCWCALASLGGLYLLNKVLKKFDRQSPVVFLLTFVLGLSALLVPVFAIVQLKGKTGILDFKSIC